MRRRRRWASAFWIAACAVACALEVAAVLPGRAEQDRLVACARGQSGYVDLTVWPDDVEHLPDCVSACSGGTTTIDPGPSDPYGDVRSCVWPARSEETVRLQFVLQKRCRETECAFHGQWGLYRQIVGVRMAQMLGVPLSEVQCHMLYWTVEGWPPHGDSPSLANFSVQRQDAGGDAGGGRRRLADELDPTIWYLQHVAFRVDSQRISRQSRGVELLFSSSGSDLLHFAGFEAEVHDISFDKQPDGAHRASYGDYQPLYQFNGFEPNELPTAPGAPYGIQLAGLVEIPEGCSDACYSVNEFLTSSRCEDACACTGERWCNLLGMCTGNAVLCWGGQPATTSLPSTLTSTTVTSTSGTAPPPATTTVAPFRGLGAGCRRRVMDVWSPCDPLMEADGCVVVGCAVVDAVVPEAACAQELCGNEGVANPSELGYWVYLCTDIDVRTAYDVARNSHCQSSTTTEEPPPQVYQGTAKEEGDSTLFGSLLPLVMILTAALGCCLVVAFARLSRLRCVQDSLQRCGRCCARCADWLVERAAPLTAARRYKARQARARTAQQQGPEAAASPTERRGRPRPTPWQPSVLDLYLPARLARLLKGTDEASPDRSVGSPGSEPPTPQNGAGARRQAWPGFDHEVDAEAGDRNTSTYSSSDGGPYSASAPNGGGAGREPLGGPGPRTAAVAPGPAAPEGTKSEGLISELRRMKTAEVPPSERKKFFREQTLRWHPDKNIGSEEEAAEMFRALQQNKGWFLSDD